jgi:hypothetical protein
MIFTPENHSRRVPFSVSCLIARSRFSGDPE